MSVSDAPGLIAGELQQIERDLEALGPRWAKSERRLTTCKAVVELARAHLRLKLKHDGEKRTVAEQDATILIKLWTDHEDLMKDLVVAEAEVAASKAQQKCLSDALSSKQSRIKIDLALVNAPSFN